MLLILSLIHKQLSTLLTCVAYATMLDSIMHQKQVPILERLPTFFASQSLLFIMQAIMIIISSLGVELPGASVTFEFLLRGLNLMDIDEMSTIID